MTLHTKYRPSTFDEVVGHDEAVASIKEQLSTGSQRTFLLSGPAGVGKTTLARLIAKAHGCDELGITEIDGATHTGVENMRKVAESALFRSLDGEGKKCYIIDECHMLSRSTWNSLLKITEEPPSHVVWVFCTTEPTKVPKTIHSRSAAHHLQAVSIKDLSDLGKKIMGHEHWDMPEDIFDLTLRKAQGSPRTLLVNMAKVATANNAKEAEVLLRMVTGSKEAIDLARLLFAQDGNFSLVRLQAILSDIKDENPEGVRIIIFHYAKSVFVGASNEAKAKWAARVLGMFEAPCVEQNGIGDIALRCARLLWLK